MRAVFSAFGRVESVRAKAFTTGIKNGLVCRLHSMRCCIAPVLSCTHRCEMQGISSAVSVYHVIFEKSKSVENALALKLPKPIAVELPAPQGLKSVFSLAFRLLRH